MPLNLFQTVDLNGSFRLSNEIDKETIPSDVNVLSLGYDTTLLHSEERKGQSDGANRRMFFADQIGSYTMISLSKQSDWFVEKRKGNIHVIPAKSRYTWWAMWKMLRSSAKLCREGRINVIQAQEPTTTGLIGFYLKVRYGIPICVSVFGPNPWDRFWRAASWYNRLIAPVARMILKRADHIIADGTITVERLKEAGIPESRITRTVMVPSNINEFFDVDGQELRSELLGSQFGSLALTVSNMSLQKNIPFLLNAFRRMVDVFPDTRLMIIGQGRRQAQYKKLAEKLGLTKSVLWAGSIPHSEISKFFAAADICLMSSRFEGFPRVFVESAASGTPIVTTFVSGCNDGVVDGVNGFVVEQDDENRFISRALDLIENEPLRKKMGAAGRGLIKKLAEKQEFNDLLRVEVWTDLLASNQPESPDE